MAKGRQKVEVDKAQLQKAIEKAEREEKFPNRSALYEKVSQIYNSIVVWAPITPSVVYLRIQEFKIPVQTEMGKRGASAANGLAKARAEGKVKQRTKRADKFKEDKKISEGIQALKNEIRKEDGNRYDGLISKFEKGSMKAAIALKCLDCCCYQPVEIKECTDNTCSLWAFRPYKYRDSALIQLGKARILEDIDEDEDEIEETEEVTDMMPDGKPE
jgi:hypothetical protein